MAEEVLVKDLLTPEMIAAGRALTEELERAGLELVCALWNFKPESSQWQLIFASPHVANKGPREVYGMVQKAIQSRRDVPGLPDLQNISVVSPDQPLIKAIRTAFRVGGRHSNIRFTRSRINDVYVEDAYILLVK